MEFLLPIADQIAVTADNTQLLQNLNDAYRDLKMIYDGASDLIFLIRVEDDGCLHFASLNRAFLQTTGYSESEILDRRGNEVLPGDVARDLIEKSNEAIQKG